MVRITFQRRKKVKTPKHMQQSNNYPEKLGVYATIEISIDETPQKFKHPHIL